MAPAFGRSISFPLSPARSSSSSSSCTKQARHVRSISLPTCRAHPLLAHLHATARAARAWAATADPCTTATTSPSSGLAHLAALHAALAELLLLPEPRAALATAGATAFSDRLLDGLLALADAHGVFRETLVDLRRHAAEAQAALRRRDAVRLASAVRAPRRAEKDLARLASSARAAAAASCRLPLMPVAPAASAAEVEVSGVLAEALAAAASASAAVFSALEAVSSAATAAAASASSKKPAATATLMSLVTRSSKAAASDENRELAALEKMERLDACIAEMEAGSDKVFRSILHTRVALLNIRTQTC